MGSVSVQISWSSILLVFCFLLLTILGTSGYPDETQDQTSALANTNNSNDCPPWFIEHGNKCECGSRIGLIMCNDTNYPEWSLYLFLGQIMTYNNVSNQTFVISSPYDTFRGIKKLNQLHVKIDVNSTTDLNDFTCSPLNREEEVFCPRCIPSHGPSVFTLDLKCYNCTGLYHGWALYLTFEILPLTLFFVIIVAFQIKPTSGILNSYVLFSQIVVSHFTFGTKLAFKYSLANTSIVFVKILQTCYGFWNLDFFRHLIPSFCVSSSINNLEVLVLQYISVFYPMALIFIAWICCILHEKNIRLIVWIWRPFKRYLSHFSVTNNPKRSVMNVFATFLILSYSKIIFISANLLNVAPVFDVHGKIVEKRIFFEPTLKLYQGEHIRYAVIAVFVFATFITIPPLILFLYQFQFFQKHILKRFSMFNVVQMFADSFQNCFKDGTSSTFDCRFFAGAYLLLRLSLFSADIIIDNQIAQWIVIALIFIIATILIAVFRPYKKGAFNCLDGTMTALFAVGTIFLAIIPSYINPKFNEFMFIFIFMVTSTPLMYVVVYVLYKCVKNLHYLKPFVHWRRRGYVEISEYRYDSDDWESSNEDDRRYREIGSTDSLQSE